MSDVAQQIVELKTQAKNRRDLKRWDRAADLLRRAISLADKEYHSTNAQEWRTKMASELADSWGLLGGVERRWALDPASDAPQRLEHLQRSIEAYDKGYKYEKESTSSGSTYNELNRLLVRLLRDPKLLATDQGAGEKMNMQVELEKIADEISQHPIDNVWTAADVALLNVLLGRQDAASAYAAFERMEPPDFARQSVLDGLTPLAKLDLPNAEALRDAERRLGARRG